MAALMLRVPAATARLLAEVDVPGERVQNDPHVTVVHLGDDIPIDEIAEVLPVVFDVTSKTPPFSVTVDRISSFDPGDDGAPVVALVSSPELHRFRDSLCVALDRAGLEYSKKFPVYRPHVTLAYADKLPGKLNRKIPEVQWGVTELVLWGSNYGSGRLIIEFPFSLPGTRISALLRAHVRLAMHWARRLSSRATAKAAFPKEDGLVTPSTRGGRATPQLHRR